jgi:nucleotide-binding universal stress UspA family protein
MYGKILVGFKGSAAGRDALELGGILARASGAELLVASLPSGSSEDLAQLAGSEGVDLLILGSTHRGGLGRVVPGAMVERILGEATCAVAVAPPGFGSWADGDPVWRPLSGDTGDVGMRALGVGFDGSPSSREALEVALELALANGAALRVYAVAHKNVHTQVEAGSGRSSAISSATAVLREELHDAVADLPAAARALPVFLHGIPSAELIAAADEGVDLLVLGSRSGGPVRRALHGSVSSAVIQEATCPVLISPSGVRASHAAVI